MVGSIFFFVRVLLDGVFVLFFAFGRVLKRFRQGSLFSSHGEKDRIAVARNSRSRTFFVTIVILCALVDGYMSGASEYSKGIPILGGGAPKLETGIRS